MADGNITPSLMAFYDDATEWVDTTENKLTFFVLQLSITPARLNAASWSLILSLLKLIQAKQE